jgi:hypothetical protein
MSIVSDYSSPAAKEALRRQRIASSLTSILISILVVVLVGLIMALILLPGLLFEHQTLVTYAANLEKEEKLDLKEMTPKVQRKPSAPSSSMAKVIASTTPSPTAIPVPEVRVPDPSVDFGSGDDFGEGWGSGSGDGSGAGGTTFFGQTSKADRIAYVIDYSASMKGEREKLMRKELSSSLDKLGYHTQYQMVFFAGPAWVGGNDVNSDKKTAKIKGARGHSFEWKCTGGAHNWETKGKKQVPQWLEATDGQLSKSKKVVKETKLVWGTIWEPALEMALSMDPQPQVIYFMTDGSAGPKSGDTARRIGLKARTKGIIINTVAMMEPRAHQAMEELAERTGGSFTKVMPGGKVVKVR